MNKEKEMDITVRSCDNDSLVQLLDLGSKCYRANLTYAFYGDHVKYRSYVIGEVTDFWLASDQESPVVVGVMKPVSNDIVNEFRKFVCFSYFHEREKTKQIEFDNEIGEDSYALSKSDMNYLAGVMDSIKFYAKRVKFINKYKG